jgi:hypothetical protein
MVSRLTPPRTDPQAPKRDCGIRESILAAAGFVSDRRFHEVEK